MVFRLQPGVRDDEITAVEHIMGDQPVEKTRKPVNRVLLQLSDGLGQAVADSHLAARQVLEQLRLVITGDAQRHTSADHVHDQPQHPR